MYDAGIISYVCDSMSIEPHLQCGTETSCALFASNISYLLKRLKIISMFIYLKYFKTKMWKIQMYDDNLITIFLAFIIFIYSLGKLDILLILGFSSSAKIKYRLFPFKVECRQKGLIKSDHLPLNRFVRPMISPSRNSLFSFLISFWPKSVILKTVFVHKRETVLANRITFIENRKKW